jgi:hypothetical protein
VILSSRSTVQRGDWRECVVAGVGVGGGKAARGCIVVVGRYCLMNGLGRESLVISGGAFGRLRNGLGRDSTVVEAVMPTRLRKGLGNDASVVKLDLRSRSWSTTEGDSPMSAAV